MAHIGDRIAKQYILEKELEHAELNSTFLARDVSGEPSVVVRIFSRLGAQELEKWRKDVLGLKNLRHPHLEHPSELGDLSDTEVYFTTPLIEGMSLTELVPGAEGLTLTEIWPLFRQIADALTSAHKSGIFGFDLDPKHIVVAYDDADNEVVHLRWLGLRGQSDDISQLRRLVVFMLKGREPSNAEVAGLISEQHHSSVQAFVDSLSKTHREQLMIPHDQQDEQLSESIVDFSLGRFLVASAILTLVCGTVLLYYWLVGSF